jgi:hypothetical protein
MSEQDKEVKGSLQEDGLKTVDIPVDTVDKKENIKKDEEKKEISDYEKKHKKSFKKVNDLVSHLLKENDNEDSDEDNEKVSKDIKKEEKKEDTKEDKSEDKKEENSEKVISKRDKLAKLLGISIEEETKKEEEVASEKRTPREIELENKIKVIEESEMLDQKLSEFAENPDERELLENEIINIMGTKKFQLMRQLPLEERISDLITMARGLQADNIKMLINKGKQKKNEYEDLVTKNNGSKVSSGKETKTEEQIIQELKIKSANGDKRAAYELAQRNTFVQSTVKKLLNKMA